MQKWLMVSSALNVALASAFVVIFAMIATQGYIVAREPNKVILALEIAVFAAFTVFGFVALRKACNGR